MWANVYGPAIFAQCLSVFGTSGLDKSTVGKGTDGDLMVTVFPKYVFDVFGIFQNVEIWTPVPYPLIMRPELSRRMIHELC